MNYQAVAKYTGYLVEALAMQRDEEIKKYSAWIADEVNKQ